MSMLGLFIGWLNALASILGRWILAPCAYLPGWLSATLAAAGTGILMLVAFKYTSNQKAIKRVRDDMKAQLLALKLYKDNVRVTLQAQKRLLIDAGRLLMHSLMPMLVMAVPITLIMTQLALWYQARPLRVGEETLVRLQLASHAAGKLSEVTLVPNSAAEVLIGPVHVPSQNEVYWQLKALQPGYQQLTFQVADQVVTKELAIGDGFMRVSQMRPGYELVKEIEHPWEPPFPPNSPVRAIELEFPERDSYTSGTDWWLAYWFGGSMIVGFCCRGLFKVNI